MAEELSVLDKDIDLFKKYFADNEYLLKAVRALMLGLGVSDSEKKAIKDTFSDELVKDAVRRKIYSPALIKDAPIGQIADFWVGVEQQLFNVPKETIYQTISVKEKVFEMLNYGFDLLSNPDLPQRDLTFKNNIIDEYQIGLIARNLYIKAVDTGLMYVKIIAGQKIESAQEAKKRLTQNSNK